MTFYEKYTAYCRKKGETPSGVAIACGLSNATATHWAQGAVPRMATAFKLADYLGVSVADLWPDTPAKTETPPEPDDGAEGDLEEALSLYRGLPAAAQEEALAYLRFLSKREANLGGRRD